LTFRCDIDIVAVLLCPPLGLLHLLLALREDLRLSELIYLLWSDLADFHSEINIKHELKILALVLIILCDTVMINITETVLLPA